MQAFEPSGSPSPPEKGPGDEAARATPKRSYTFPKEEHLCRKKLIDELFSGRGSSFGVYPLRLIWLPAEARIPTPPQVLISVSKRTFKRAVDRNYIKRLLREAYRLNKFRLLEAPGGHPVAVLGILYTGKEQAPLALIEKKLISGFQRLLAQAGAQPTG